MNLRKGQLMFCHSLKYKFTLVFTHLIFQTRIMNKIDKEWFNKISRILVEVPDLLLRLNKLEEIRNHIFDSLKDPEGEFPMLVKKINGEIEETKDEIKNQGKSGLDLILEAAEKIEKAETEFYHNENVFKT